MAFKELPFHPLATKASEMEFYTPYFDVGDFKLMEVQREVYSGYATAFGQLEVRMEHSLDLKQWYPLTPSYTVVVAPVGPAISHEEVSFTEFLRYVRAHVILDSGGGGDLVLFTFSLLGIARDG